MVKTAALQRFKGFWIKLSKAFYDKIKQKDVAQFVAQSLRNIAKNEGAMVTENKDKYYTMQEMADVLEVNKTTVYRYLKKEHISPATVESNTNHYSATVLQQLKKHFKTDGTGSSTPKTANDRLIETLQQQVQSLQEELRDEKFRSDKALDAKDRQIDDLNERLKESHQLQLGLQKKLEMLPEPNETTIVASNDDVEEGNNDNGKSDVPESSPEQNSRPGFWQRLFGKN